MRVFILSTGRCGSMTFAKACSHITNYTSGHETRAGMIGPERLRYPDRHIEVDNRLAWFLGELEGDFFIHLHRDQEAVARSYNRRWGKGGIISAFADGITMGHGPYSEEDRLDLCRWYVRTVDWNIEAFCADYDGRRESMRMNIDDDPKERFSYFWDHIGARGDSNAALAEFDIHHNAS